MKVDLSTKIDLDEIDDEMFICQVSVGLLALILIILMAYCYKYQGRIQGGAGPPP